jgi:type VI secretion system protein ImpJ
MIFADDIPAAIQWHEGMLLTPQHFQQDAARTEMLLQYSTLSAAPFAWGVQRLHLDTRLISSGSFRVLQLEAMMPDGTVVSHRAERDRELMVDLIPHKEAMRSAPVAVHLALPARASAAVRGGLSRYESFESEPIADENTGNADLRIPRLRPSLTLFLGETPPPKYISFPLAQVRFEDENYYLADYVPASLSVPANSALGRTCSQLVARLREKAVTISEQVRSPAAVLDMPMMLDSKLRVQTLVAALPRMEAVLSTGVAHPFTLYTELCGVAGQLCSLGASLLPPVFSTYNHRELRASFNEVISFCHRMVDEGVPESYRALTFRFADGVFSLNFEPEYVNKRLVLGMRVPGGAGERDVVSWAEECLIGSQSVIQSLRERRILGAARQHVDRDQDLLPARGVILFSLRPDPEYIRQSEPLQILNFNDRPGSIRPLEIVLYVKQASQ